MNIRWDWTSWMVIPSEKPTDLSDLWGCKPLPI